MLEKNRDSRLSLAVLRLFCACFSNYYANSIYAFLQFALDLFLESGIFRLFAGRNLADTDFRH